MTGTRQAATTVNLTADWPDLWLTAVLRPAGRLAGAAVDRLVDSLTALAGSASLVVVDLAAASVLEPEVLAQALRLPGGLLSGPDRCLLLVGADQALLSALDRCGAQIATLDTPPPSG
ncbi:MAG: hypothetical protein IRZ05_00040 [Micromonosporaceae bacterium]|jgi:hypothetical protein|nr:hypothetical protein [Micromonosporaceae bacterium]